MIKKDPLSEIITYWFQEVDAKDWFSGRKEFDALLIKKWSIHYENSLYGKYNHWKKTGEGCLGLCLLWDQFPRNAFRGTPRAFTTDSLVLETVHQAILSGQDQELEKKKKAFLYMPLMHSENLADQARSVTLFQELSESNARFARLHAKVITRFGRFPGRNQALGRQTTDQEAAFLASPEGHSF